MDLWTEFEGHTIDSAFALNKLLQTEGRSAFFSTLNDKGESVLIRIVECHFDEDEILARWRGVQVLNHPNFLRIDSYGQFLIEADDITAVYVVFERVDANLGQVLERGRLSAADAAQIAMSLVSGLQMLHANGFVHEHVEPRNIFAVGETVKMRSDCVRETPEGERGFEARRRDVFDLSIVLTQVLTGSKSPFSDAGHSPLPAPFDEIVHKGMSGEWGLEAIASALAAHKLTKSVPPPRATPAPAPKPEPAPLAAKPESAPSPKAASTHAPTEPIEIPVRPLSSRAARMESRFVGTLFDEKPVHHQGPPRSRASFLIEEWRQRFVEWRELFQEPLPRWIAALVMFLVVILCGWALTHRLFGAHPGTTSQPAPAAHSTSARTTTARATTAPPHGSPASRQPKPAQTSAATPTSARGVQWRVVAFTYSRQDQAQKKAASLAQKLPGVKPEVFSPNGRGPWLVTVGGPLDKDAAYALAHRARSLGLPHDTYAQNYTVR